MVIQKNGKYHAEVPVKLSLYAKEAGFLMVGDDAMRILISGNEVKELYELLRPFVEKERVTKP